MSKGLFFFLLTFVMTVSLMRAKAGPSPSPSPSLTSTPDAWKLELPRMPSGLVSETLPILTKIQGPSPTAADIARAKAQADKVEQAGYPAVAQVLREYAELRA